MNQLLEFIKVIY